MKHVFRQYLIHPQAQQAAEASLCVGKQSAEAFWAMHDLLFERTQEWGAQQDAAELFAQYAVELGLDGGAFAACLDSGETAPQIQVDMQQGQSVGVKGTPAFLVNDWFISGFTSNQFERFQQAIEGAMRGEPPPPTPTPAPAPFDADPERPGYTYGGDATVGSVEADIVLLEFLDFGSAEDLKYVQETWPELQSQYVESGKVRVVVKHFPAADQAAGLKAAEATECAGQQGAFWAMHDLLFQQQEEWTGAADVVAVLKRYAGKLALDVEAFSACLDEGQTGNKVEQDVAIAQQNQLPPSPQFVLFRGGQGGIVPLADLQKVIGQLLGE